MSRDAALYDIIRLIRPLYRALGKSVADRLEGTTLTVGMRAVLEVIEAGGPQTVPQIGRVLAIGRQPVQRTVDAARALGFVELRANPAHRRSWLVALTARGETAFRQVRDREQAALRPIARNLSREQIESCSHVLATLTEQFQQMAYQEQDDA